MTMPTDIGIVDLGIGFPYRSHEEKKAAYDFFRANLKDDESLREMEFPAQYMFKDVPDVVDPDVDPVQWIVEKMDTFHIEIAKVGLNPNGIRAKQEYPGRFYLNMSVDPNKGVQMLRDMEKAKAEHDIVSVSCFPSGLVPQVAIDDAKMYPIYAKCVELDIPIFVYVGVPGPRIRFAPQDPALLDEVCWFFPELKIITRHGGQPWTELMAKLLLKWPNLYYSTSAFAPKHYDPVIIDFVNKRGADKIIYAGYYPMGLDIDRIFNELPDVPFRDHVWPKFLYENAARVLKIS